VRGLRRRRPTGVGVGREFVFEVQALVAPGPGADVFFRRTGRGPHTRWPAARFERRELGRFRVCGGQGYDQRPRQFSGQHRFARTHGSPRGGQVLAGKLLRELNPGIWPGEPLAWVKRPHAWFTAWRPCLSPRARTVHRVARGVPAGVVYRAPGMIRTRTRVFPGGACAVVSAPARTQREGAVRPTSTR
jgi:hypothetical protein